MHAYVLRHFPGGVRGQEVEVAFALPSSFEHEDYAQILTDIAAKIEARLGMETGRLSTGPGSPPLQHIAPFRTSDAVFESDLQRTLIVEVLQVTARTHP